jgi:predicted amidohydrolase YtcJ
LILTTYTFLVAAYASFLENKTGSFSIGKQFDAVVWNQSLLSTSQETILDTGVLSTIVDGKAVWGKLYRSAESNPEAFRRDSSKVWSYSG